MHTSTTPKVLYVDDDSDDCNFLSETFAATSTNADLICASGGEEALQYLNSVDESALPSLIVLDLNMPKWDGRQTLKNIKSNPHYSGIPVVILSTSNNIMDKEVCTRLGAASYLQKPNRYEGYRDIVKRLLPLMQVIHE